MGTIGYVFGIYWWMSFAEARRSAKVNVIKNAADVVNRNLLVLCLCARVTFLWIPLKLQLLSLSTNISRLLVEILWGDLFFYTVHRIAHRSFFFQFHKLHHTVRLPSGYLAFYCSVTEMIVMNFGSIFISHIYFGGHTAFHLMLTFAVLCGNTILFSHASDVDGSHQIHGRNFIIDRPDQMNRFCLGGGR